MRSRCWRWRSFIRSLGYQAVATQNDTNLAIPYAVAAGLGEYGRSGLCITREFGPRVRFGRILTDMPLARDEPVSFGVEKTCDVCRRLRQHTCPPQAIDHGPPSTYTFNRSNIAGVKKWTTDGEKCFKFWVSRGTDCANCVRTCPYNKDFSGLWPKLLRALLNSPLRRLALKLDDATPGSRPDQAVELVEGRPPFRGQGAGEGPTPSIPSWWRARTG